RADDSPRLAGVGGREDHLAPVVHRVVIERIDRQRRRPVAAILRVLRRRVERDHPRRDRSRRSRASVEARQLVAVAARPDDVGIGEIREREAGLAAAEIVLPLSRVAAAAEAAATEPTESAAAAESASADAKVGQRRTLAAPAPAASTTTAAASTAAATWLHGVVGRLFLRIARAAHRA